MRALTLKAPWGYAIAKLGKNIENRTWRPPASIIGQRIAIHQGVGLDRPGLRWIEEMYDQFEVEHGVITCTAVVAGWIEKRKHSETLTAREADRLRRSEWFGGPVGWVLTGVRRPRARVRIKGMLGVWQVPARVAARL